MKEQEAGGGGWYGGLSYTGAVANTEIKHNGAGGSSYNASANTEFSTSGGTVKVISSSQTTGGGTSYSTTSDEHRNGVDGSATIAWAGY